MDQRQDDFPAFVAEHEHQLRGTALLLTGCPVEADDLVVAALARTHRRWPRLDSPAAALTDAQEALVSATLGRTRLPATGRGGALVAGPEADVDHRWLQALADLDPRTRAITVLRLHEGQDEGAVATLVGCSPAEVGSALADALERLAPLLLDDPAEPVAAPAPVAVPGPSVTSVPARPVGHDLAPDAADPYAIYRRPGTPAPRAERRPASVPAPTPVAVPQHPDDDPNAIYRRPT
ncbi:sigma factor [Modestobacter sp. VKM Ac-2977]|uniref:sigma factor n=1 Tax=Modestobacter sp. VKM Ac-2977 TaxID=3004131 RepID=UPI0022AA7ED6|nr:sigma factor [Modestobacter sp. VKM Ac-2977]MCZ2820635.1 sigma factor [Modestobacter sp. VKM Ac-2977]